MWRRRWNTGSASAAGVPARNRTIVLKGAGATFPYPVYAKWFTNYRRENPNVEITYDAVGSEAGVRRLLAGEWISALRTVRKPFANSLRRRGKYLLFPSVVGAVVPIVNLPGFAGDIAIHAGGAGRHLSREDHEMERPDVAATPTAACACRIWTSWWCIARMAAAPAMRGPIIFRKTSPEWKAQVGAGLDPKWPVGAGGQRQRWRGRNW